MLLDTGRAIVQMAQLGIIRASILYTSISDKKGRTKFTTSGAHDVIAITSPQKIDLCTEKL